MISTVFIFFPEDIKRPDSTFGGIDDSFVFLYLPFGLFTFFLWGIKRRCIVSFGDHAMLFFPSFSLPFRVGRAGLQ